MLRVIIFSQVGEWAGGHPPYSRSQAPQFYVKLCEDTYYIDSSDMLDSRVSISFDKSFCGS